MAATEYRILTKLIESGTLEEAKRLGLKAEHFADSDARQIWKYLSEYWNTPATERTLPTFAKVRKHYPGFLPSDTSSDQVEDLARLINEVKDTRFHNDVLGVAERFVEMAKSKPQRALEKVKEEMQMIELVQSSENTCTTLSDIESIAREKYFGAQTGAIYGIPWPWKCLTEDTLGKQPGELYVFYGRMKSMKTWILLYNAAFDFLENHRRVLVWSREMAEDRLAMRMASLLAKVDYQIFKAGMLPKKLEDQAFAALHDITHRDVNEDYQRAANRGSPDLLLLAGHNAPRKLEDLDKIVQKFQPHVLYLDSYYHMESERSSGQNERNKKLAAFSEDIKGYAVDNDMPIVAVHQANRFAEKTYGNTMVDLADTDVLAREADLICRCLMKPDGNKALWEEDYEGEFDRVKEAHKTAKLLTGNEVKRVVGRIGRPLFGPSLLKPQEASTRKSLGERLLDRTHQDRLSAQIGLVMGGNREGVLKAFIVRAIPGYDFSMINDNPSMGDIKKWVQAEASADDINDKGNGGPPNTQNFQDALRKATGKKAGS
jgi:replicative DNA helicase